MSLLNTPVPLRDSLIGLDPYGAPEIDGVIRLNVNENPYPPSPPLRASLAQAVTASLDNINRYPDRDATALRADLASYLNNQCQTELTADQIWAANGSNEVMTHLLLAFGGPGRKLAIFTPTYSMYPQYARDTMTDLVQVPRGDDYQISMESVRVLREEHQPDIVLIAAPNNPTGTGTPLSLIDEVASFAPWLVIVDEAYQEFTSEIGCSAVGMIGQHPNLVVTRTMSKAFALAGARLGYMAADPSIVAAARLVRLPYHMGAQTQALARAALAASDEPLRHVAQLRKTCQDTQVWLRSLGLTVPDSQTNFAMFGPFKDSHLVWSQLLELGVLVREVGPAGYLRVSMGTPDDMVAFRECLVEVLDRDNVAVLDRDNIEVLDQDNQEVTA